MTVSHSNLLELLGKSVSFNDLSFEQQLARIALPTDYSVELLNSLRKGTVVQVCYDLTGNNSLCIAPNYPNEDTAEYYLFSDIKNFVIH